MVNKKGTNGNDIIDGGATNDRLEGLGGSDILNGFDGNDELIGDALFGSKSAFGNDLLNGGVGNDTMRGGRGNDRYIVDSIGDQALENSGEGNDTVEASINFTLGANLERLVLTGANAINGTGNALDNTITGNDAANALSGGAGNDTLIGSGGNDILDGGSGTNTLNGGLGDDTYNITTLGINAINDVGGIDTVQSAFTFTLGANIENLTLRGFASNGTGNALNNVITGNRVANVLNGGNGDDTLNGGAGNDTLIGGLLGNDTLDGGTGADSLSGGFNNDTYLVDNAGDVVVESSPSAAGGIDTILSSVNIAALAANVENLTLVGTAVSGTGNSGLNKITGNELANNLDGSSGDDTLVGEAGDDLLIGGSGNDTLIGGAGNDTLNGGGNADVYVFSNVANQGVDVINNFNSGVDKIRLESFGALTGADVAIVANDDVAAASGGLITYSAATGNLFFNQNGAATGFGTGGRFASLNGIPAVAAADFVIAA